MLGKRMRLRENMKEYQKKQEKEKINSDRIEMIVPMMLMQIIAKIYRIRQL